MNKWIRVNGNQIERGEGVPPSGTLYFVDRQSSKALVDDVLYENNKPVGSGAHEINLKGGQTVTVDVDAHGKAKRRETGGGDFGTSKPTPSGDSSRAGSK